MPKLPRHLLRNIRAQKAQRVAEGEIEVVERKFERADGVETGNSGKRALTRSARRQARQSEHRIKKVRTFPYECGDLVEIVRPAYDDKGFIVLSKGDYGMIIEVFANGEWCSVQVGPNIVKCKGTHLRMPWDDEDDDE